MSYRVSLEVVLRKAPEAVPLNQTAMEIIRQTGDLSSTTSDITRTLQTDQALSAQVLRIANSAFYGLPRQVASVSSAVTLLGHKTLRNLALTATMSKAIAKPVSGYGLPRGELFKHSLAVARTAHQISKQTNQGTPDEAYAAGLLHDIGKLILDTHVESSIGEIANLAINDSVSFATAERQLLGMDHAEVGAILTEQWGLPEFITNAIRHHHRVPSGSDPDEIVALVAVCTLANILTRKRGTGVGANETPDLALPSIIREILSLSDKDVLDLGMELGDELGDE